MVVLPVTESAGLNAGALQGSSTVLVPDTDWIVSELSLHENCRLACAAFCATHEKVNGTPGTMVVAELEKLETEGFACGGLGATLKTPESACVASYKPDAMDGTMRAVMVIVPEDSFTGVMTTEPDVGRSEENAGVPHGRAALMDGLVAKRRTSLAQSKIIFVLGVSTPRHVRVTEPFEGTVVEETEKSVMGCTDVPTEMEVLMEPAS